MNTPDAQAPAGHGVIHDLAYKRYDGLRRAPAWRPVVIARYALATQWRQRGVKLCLLAAMLVGALAAAILGAKWGITSMMSSELGARGADDLARALAEGDGDAAVWALSAQWVPTMLLTLICGAPAISADLNAGAFQFHFSRPVTVGQYLVGRMLSATGWAALAMLSTLALLCAVRAGVTGRALPMLAVFLKSLLPVAARVLTLAAVSLGVSSLTRRKGLAQAMFAATILGTWMTAKILAVSVEKPWISALDVMGATDKLAAQLVGAARYAGLAAAAPSLAALAWSGVFLAIAAWRLSRAEVVRG